MQNDCKVRNIFFCNWLDDKTHIPYGGIDSFGIDSSRDMGIPCSGPTVFPFFAKYSSDSEALLSALAKNSSLKQFVN